LLVAAEGDPKPFIGMEKITAIIWRIDYAYNIFHSLRRSDVRALAFSQAILFGAQS
jgi:hypothetical protein